MVELEIKGGSVVHKNLILSDDDGTRIHKNPKVDVCEVILESLFQLLYKGNSILHYITNCT